MAEVRAGRLRHRAWIQTATESRDGASVIETWADTAERWMSIEPLTGRELWEAERVQSRVTHRIVMRHYDGLTADQRIRFGTRYFHIVSARNIEERDRMMVVMAVEAD